ncbi:MAG: hypothetical protein ACJ8F1_11785 [Polyangia bacterium]
MRTRIWLAAVTVLGLIGCGGGTTRTSGVETDWVINYAHSTPAGVAECIEGPYSIPSGAEIVFDINDTVGDAMYVSAVSNSSGSCDGSQGFGTIYHSDWAGTDTGYTGTLPGGLYNLAVACDNLVEDCIYTVVTFGYLY